MSAGFQPWFEKWPGLFKQQADILEPAGFKLDSDILNRERRVIFIGNSRNDPKRQLIVAFPDAFPSAAPKIHDTPGSKLLSRHHRSDTRQFCLFGFNENRWDATKSVAEALSEGEELISRFKDSDTTSDQGTQSPEPITKAILYAKDTAILIPPPISTFADFWKLKSLSGRFSGKYVYSGEAKKESCGRGIVLEASFGDVTVTCAEPFSAYLDHKGREIRGEWFYLSEQPTQENLPNFLRACLQEHKGLKRTAEYWIALIFNEESGQATERRRVWVVARANGEGRFDLIRTFPYIQEERRPRIPGLDGLETKKITVVGCGSLGSKVAASLAASGVNNFSLVDYDHFEPCNAVRHELGVESFGLNKAMALLHRLSSLNPAVAANSRWLEFQVASTESIDREKHFYEMVHQSDLVIDATAMHSVSHFINELAFETRVPALFVSVTNGAWGGEVVRVIPGKTPCWVCWTDEYFETKPPASTEATAEVFAPGCDQPTFTGTTYEVGFIANLAASMAVDTLLGRSEFGDISNNYIRWSERDRDGRLIFRTEVLPTHFREGCPFRGV